MRYFVKLKLWTAFLCSGTAVILGKERQKEYLEYGKRFVYVFAESKHMTCYFSINDDKKQKNIQRFRYA